ncbi:hypothetical protein SEA_DUMPSTERDUDE_32 [Gordonia phage DumpsterDude]|uniref:Uncharacterized protein n=1 Tax=Gordonia phage DumpsterDude TaxID=2713262 RepID=A0A6G8R090_9CAUD|nr:hypothetical protein JZX77_gp32 [Gordonia phage DumpsterDude]QIN93620.1 hypothetical protein SEA_DUMPSTERDUDE_32 [Gordonia phage DumpsterDude]
MGERVRINVQVAPRLAGAFDLHSVTSVADGDSNAPPSWQNLGGGIQVVLCDDEFRVVQDLRVHGDLFRQSA